MIIQALAEDKNEEIKEKWKDFKIPCVILSSMDHKMEISIAFSFYYHLISIVENEKNQMYIESLISDRIFMIYNVANELKDEIGDEWSSHVIFIYYSNRVFKQNSKQNG